VNATANLQILLAARPVGMPKPSDWEFVRGNAREPGEGEVLVKVLYLSLDPAMRGWMNEGRSYIPPVRIGDTMRAGGVGLAVASRAPGIAAGDYVYGTLDIQEYATVAGSKLRKVDPSLAPLPVFLNVLGMPGMTAYFGLFDVGQPQPGNTVVVSGAAGAVGMTVGQLAKIHGCRVVGIAGGPEKCAYLRDELGFDAAIDYKATPDLGRELREHCPNGIDVYFDNVGGATLDACLARLAMHARVVICGAISQYNNTTPVAGPSNYLSLLVNRARMQGMVVFDYEKRYDEAVAAMAPRVVDGSLKSREDIVRGIETFPDTLLKLFRGENFGKLVLQVADV
jgi:NADPH-dependent curcumin reductase CurA